MSSNWREELRGSVDGSKGNALPENSSLEYRDSYAKSARRNSRTSNILGYCAIGMLFSLMLGSYFDIGDSIKEKELRRNREERVVQYYQKNESCPSGLTARGIDDRVQLWMNEVENEQN